MSWQKWVLVSICFLTAVVESHKGHTISTITPMQAVITYGILIALVVTA